MAINEAEKRLSRLFFAWLIFSLSFLPYQTIVQAPTIKTRAVWATAYSSTREETDSTPFLTASGELVHTGVVAANFLPFGSHIHLPEAFGSRIFTVADRMNRRKENFIDIWMPSKKAAVTFGVHRTEIEILENEARGGILP